MEFEEKASKNGNTNNGSANKEASLKDRIKDPIYKKKFLQWMCLPIGMFSVGIFDSFAGATSLDLQIITSTDENRVSYFLTAVNLGYLLGSFFGGVLFEKASSYFLMFVSGCLGGLLFIATPYCSTFAEMFIIRCAEGLTFGIYTCILFAEHMEIWGTNGQALLQLINFIYAIGGSVGPIIAEPFLAEKETRNKTVLNNGTTTISNNVTALPNLWSTNLWYNNSATESTNTSFFYSNTTEPTNSSVFDLLNNVTDSRNSALPRTTNVFYAFLIAGILLVVSMIPTLIVYLVPKKSVASVKETVAYDIVDRKLPFFLKITLLVLIFLLFFTYSLVELIFNSFFMTFIVDEYQEVSKSQGARIFTFYWASFAAGRFCSIFVSKYLTPVRQLYLHLSLMAFAFSGLVVSAFYSRIDILTGFVCLGGISCSAIFPAFCSWAEAELLKVTGLVSAVILIGASSGITFIPLVLGYLMEHVSNFWFCHFLIAYVVLGIAFFILILTLNRCFINKKYGKMGELKQVDQRKNSDSIKNTQNLHTNSVTSNEIVIKL